eukprot:763264-Hanusia_phi.AAC.1
MSASLSRSQELRALHGLGNLKIRNPACLLPGQPSTASLGPGVRPGSDAAFSEALSLLLDDYYRHLHRTSSEVEKRAYYDACAAAFGKMNKSSTDLAFAASTLECDRCKGAHKTEDCRAKNLDRKKYSHCYKNRLKRDSELRKFSPPKSDDQKSQRHSKISSQGSAPQPSHQGNNSSHASPLASFPTAQ